MDKYITRKRINLSSLFYRFIGKLMQRPDYYPIRYYKRVRRGKYDFYSH